MTKRKDKEWNAETKMDAEIAQRNTRIEEDLEIMDRHAADLAGVEEDVQDSMRRWDREHKNARLHSVPRHLKHVR
jgi:hypothetical protein